METQALKLAAQDEMIAEARDIIDQARARGVVLRLYGGLAVRAYCDVIEFCARDYSDFDMIGLKAQRQQLRELFVDLGFTEELRVAQATVNAQLQFVRPCVHGEGDARAHPDDHIDVFLDTFRMGHQLDLKDRLTLDDYTISVTDQLLTKLQVFELEEKDVRDALTLLKDVELAEDEGQGRIGAAYIAARCATDWGLYHDVERNLSRCAEQLARYRLTAEETARIRSSIARLQSALEAAPKPLRWRARARVGERAPWHAPVEDQDVTG
jgi:hypothetical protein